MADEPVFQGMDLEELLASAGRSFTEAQRSLLKGVNVPATMMLSQAELELKVVVETDAKGRVLVSPVSSKDITRGTINPGMLSTLRINLISSAGESSGDRMPAENLPPSVGEGSAARVPDLKGLTMNAAAARLKKGLWKYAAHAASREEIAAFGEGLQGKVIKQKPAAAAAADQKTKTVHFWVNLGSVPVQAIDGIGDKMAANLAKAGIRSVGELSLADVPALAKGLRMNETRARDFVNMAALMSRLTVLGLSDEVVELLGKGLGIASIDQLAKAAPSALYQDCRNVLDSGKIRSPRSFKVTPDDAAEWIATAKKGLRSSSRTS
ncbi:MAG: DUF4332 domain-containing protein [Pontiellaceae bacterium]|jgi:predicted flap endonuclease-1-like 5' DNA nuclease|nr:DUF4332 domain-containing protein [Pontiellaceae bacterium]